MTQYVSMGVCVSVCGYIDICKLLSSMYLTPQ